MALADRLLMLLVYYRTHVTHRFLGFLFGIDDSAVGSATGCDPPMVLQGRASLSDPGHPA